MNGNFRWGDVGVIAAIICNIVVGTWEIAHLDGRVGTIEKEQIRDELALDSLRTANGISDVHFSKLDDAISVMKDQVSAILEIVRQPDTNTGADQTTPNFPKRK